MSHTKGAKFGGVRTVEDLRQRCVIDEVTGCWLWSLSTCQGLPRVFVVSLDGERQKVTGTTAAYMLQHGGRPARGRKVYKTCLVKLCVCPDHMKAGTRKEFGAFMADTGAWRGQLNRVKANRKTVYARAATKLTAEIAQEIRLSELSDGELADMHNIAKSQINAIRNGKSWRPGAVGNSVFNMAR